MAFTLWNPYFFDNDKKKDFNFPLYYRYGLSAPDCINTTHFMELPSGVIVIIVHLPISFSVICLICCLVCWVVNDTRLTNLLRPEVEIRIIHKILMKLNSIFFLFFITVSFI